MISEVPIVAFLWEEGSGIPKEFLHSLASSSLRSLVSFLIFAHGLEVSFMVEMPALCAPDPTVMAHMEPSLCLAVSCIHSRMGAAGPREASNKGDAITKF